MTPVTPLPWIDRLWLDVDSLQYVNHGECPLNCPVTQADELVELENVIFSPDFLVLMRSTKRFWLPLVAFDGTGIKEFNLLNNKLE